MNPEKLMELTEEIKDDLCSGKTSKSFLCPFPNGVCDKCRLGVNSHSEFFSKIEETLKNAVFPGDEVWTIWQMAFGNKWIIGNRRYGFKTQALAEAECKNRNEEENRE